MSPVQLIYPSEKHEAEPCMLGSGWVCFMLEPRPFHALQSTSHSFVLSPLQQTDFGHHLRLAYAQNTTFRTQQQRHLRHYQSLIILEPMVVQVWYHSMVKITVLADILNFSFRHFSSLSWILKVLLILRSLFSVPCSTNEALAFERRASKVIV